ncbi:MAG: TonB-dependent receptor [Ignavibacteriae bacterium]|nr:TonB-dependent receptor [Ignavibacteriota bacterium]
MKIYILPYFVIISILNTLFAQENKIDILKGIITGNVISATTNNPLKSVTIKIEETKLGALTDAQGKFTIKNIPAGVYTVKFSILGYETYSQSNVIVSTAMPIQLEVQLVEKVIELEGAEVRSSYFIRLSEAVSSTQTFSGEEIKRTPGIGEDIIRATSLLPGVGVTSAGRNDLIVRGGAPFENLFIVDNIEIANINHFGTQGTSGGPLSLINIDFVKNVTFSAGGFGAKYGDKTSSITNITLRNGNEESFGAKAVLSATGFGLNFEGPISNNGSFILGARRSYLDFIFKAAVFAFIPEYWDFIGKARYKIDNNNSLSFLTIGALDDVSLNNEKLDNRFKNSTVAVPNQKQYFSGLTWQHLLGNGFINVTLGETYSKYSTFQNDSLLNIIFKNNSSESETSLKSEIDLMISPKLELMFGNQLKWATNLAYDILIPGFMRTDSLGIPSELVIDTNFTGYKNSTYASVTAGISNFKISLGGRLDYNKSLEKHWYISPRGSVLYQLNEVSAFTISLGRYYQSPSYIWLLGGSPEKLNSIKSDQIVLGFDHTPREDLKVQVELFYKWYDNYPARLYRPTAVLAPSGFEDISYEIPFGLEPLTSKGEGFARGLELFIQKKLSEIPVSGLFSLTLGQSKFKSLIGNFRPGSYDVLAIINLACAWRINNEWEISAKFRYNTGLPTTPFFTEGENIGKLNFSQYNEGERLPSNHSMDFRIDKIWNLKSFMMVTYVDIQNLYGKKNVSAVRWDYRNNVPKYSTSFGILPSIGIVAEF